MIARRALLALALTAAPALALAVDEAGVQTSSPAAGEFGGGNGTTIGGTAAGGGVLNADQVRGTIDSIDATRRRVTIRDDQGNLVGYDLAAGAAVQVGQRDSSLSALSHGDNVTVTVADADPTQARALRVESPQ